MECGLLGFHGHPCTRRTMCGVYAVRTCLVSTLAFILVVLVIATRQELNSISRGLSSLPDGGNGTESGKCRISSETEKYLNNYDRCCRRVLARSRTNGPGSRSRVVGFSPSGRLRKSGNREDRDEMEPCPCVPESVFTLNTDIIARHEAYSWRHLERVLYHVSVGGFWEPACVARERIAVIVPYRDRERHLKAFLSILHPILQSQRVHYQIFVIEQVKPQIFNRAALMNVGFLEARRQNVFDCYVFHDVDLIPESNLNLYTCLHGPLHLGAYMSKWNYRLPYPDFFGGAMALTSEQMEAINGFPNNFYGWGGEDDAIQYRIRTAKLPICRHPADIGKMYMLSHGQDKFNPPNPKRFILMGDAVNGEGLNTIRYRIVHSEKTRLYTLVQVAIERDYDARCIVNASLAPSVDGNYLDCYTEENFFRQTLDCCKGYHEPTLFCCETNWASGRFYHWLYLLLAVFIVIVMNCRK